MSMNCGPGTFAYVIQPGDTFWNLAERYNVDVSDIIAANPDADPDNLYIGQVVCIPGDPPEPERRPGFRPPRRPRFRRPRRVFRPVCPRAYYVQPGDTLYRISYRFGVPISSIIAANPQINFNYPLQIGQFICLPYR